MHGTSQFLGDLAVLVASLEYLERHQNCLLIEGMTYTGSGATQCLSNHFILVVLPVMLEL